MENTPHPQPPVYEGNPLISIFWGTWGIWVCSWSLFEFPHSLVVGAKWAPKYFPQMVLENASVVIKSHGARQISQHLKTTLGTISAFRYGCYFRYLWLNHSEFDGSQCCLNGGQDYGPNSSTRACSTSFAFPCASKISSRNHPAHMVTAPLQRPVIFEAIRISFGFAFVSFLVRAFNPLETYVKLDRISPNFGGEHIIICQNHHLDVGRYTSHRCSLLEVEVETSAPSTMAA